MPCDEPWADDFALVNSGWRKERPRGRPKGQEVGRGGIGHRLEVNMGFKDASFGSIRIDGVTQPARRDN
jgi:hypothetical protein